MREPRRASGPSTRAWVHASDLRILFELPLLFALSWLLPQRAWFTACQIVEAIKARIGLFDPRPVAVAAACAFNTLPSRKFAIESAAGRSECHLQVLRCYRPGGWKPALILEGYEHIDRALAGGRGCVLWVGHFCFNSLATKMALHRAGYALWHVSRPEHGFSKSRFGMACLNPLRIGAETPFLAGRIEIDRASPGNAMLQARQILAGNGIVSITAGAWEGRKPVDVDLLGGRLKLAAGAAGLALLNGAALLPVFTIRGAGRDIRVIVESEIAAPSAGTLHERGAVIAQSFADRLAVSVMSEPAEWRDWKNLKPISPTLPSLAQDIGR